MITRAIVRSELPVDTVELAQYLIGKVLVHRSSVGLTSGRIVETEAYTVGDDASHAFRGMTRRNQSMFLERGHAYVYRIYGIWCCVNVSSESRDIGAGVLLRALEPVDGIDLMRQRRSIEKVTELMRGPGLLCSAMGIDLKLDGVDLCNSAKLWLAEVDNEQVTVNSSRRVGLTKNTAALLRFYVIGNNFVSGPKPLIQALDSPCQR